MERRVLLSVAGGNLTLPTFVQSLDEGGTVVAGPDGQALPTYDAGDGYWADGRRVGLKRVRNQLAIRLKPGTEAQEPVPGVALTPTSGGLAVLADSDAAGTHLAAALSALQKKNAVAWSGPAFADDSGQLLQVGDELIVGLKPGTDAAGLLGNFAAARPLTGTADQYIVTVSGGPLTALRRANQLRTDARVSFASPNFHFRIDLQAVPNDPQFASQWHLNNTGQSGGTAGADAKLPAAWDLTGGSGQIVVAIVDDGVQVSHPDLPIFTNVGETPGNGIDDDGNGYVDDVHGWDFVDNDNDPSPITAFDNHGTAVAGVAAASGNNGLGVSGAAWNTRILPVKIATDTTGTGGGFVSSATIASAIYYAAGRTANGLGQWRGADVINNSWGGGTPDATLTAAFDWASSNGRGGLGSVTLAASGNGASGFGSYSLTGFPAGNWIVEWRYVKNASLSSGDDTVWLANVGLPDGSRERFNTPGLPAGWSSSGSALWSVVDDPAHAFGTGRYEAKAGTIGNSQTTTLRSRPISVSSTSDLTFRAWVSSQSLDQLNVYASGDGGATWLGPFFSANGVPVVASAAIYPANLASVIAVGASTDFDYRADYSQYGSALDVVAPSSGGLGGITTTDRTGSSGYAGGDYTSGFGGTSSATPLVAGIAALLLSRNPGLTPGQVRSALRNTADKVGGVTYAAGFNTYYGYGRVNAGAALASVPGDTAGPTLVSAASRKTHGSAGTFDLPLSLTGNTRATGATVEPRKDGPSQLRFSFSEPIVAQDGVVSANEFAPTNATFASASVSGDTLTLNLTGVVNSQYVTVSLQGLSDLAGNAMAGDTDVVIGALYGDIDRSGSVNLLDFQQVKLNLLQPLTASNFLADLDTSGSVNLLDFQVIKLKLLSSLS